MAKKDYYALENDLNEHFEKDFAKNYLVIKDFIVHRKLTQEVNDALFYFAKYGVIGDFRTPRYKQQMDDTIFNVLSKLLPESTPEQKSGLEEMFEYKKK